LEIFYVDICHVNIQQISTYIPPLHSGGKKQQQTPPKLHPSSQFTAITETCPVAVLNWHMRVHNLLSGLGLLMGRKSNGIENKIWNGYAEIE